MGVLMKNAIDFSGTVHDSVGGKSAVLVELDLFSMLHSKVKIL